MCENHGNSFEFVTFSYFSKVRVQLYYYVLNVALTRQGAL